MFEKIISLFKSKEVRVSPVKLPTKEFYRIEDYRENYMTIYYSGASNEYFPRKGSSPDYNIFTSDGKPVVFKAEIRAKKYCIEYLKGENERYLNRLQELEEGYKKERNYKSPIITLI